MSTSKPLDLYIEYFDSTIKVDLLLVVETPTTNLAYDVISYSHINTNTLKHTFRFSFGDYSGTTHADLKTELNEIISNDNKIYAMLDSMRFYVYDTNVTVSNVINYTLPAPGTHIYSNPSSNTVTSASPAYVYMNQSGKTTLVDEYNSYYTVERFTNLTFKELFTNLHVANEGVRGRLGSLGQASELRTILNNISVTSTNSALGGTTGLKYYPGTNVPNPENIGQSLMYFILKFNVERMIAIVDNSLNNSETFASFKEQIIYIPFIEGDSTASLVTLKSTDVPLGSSSTLKIGDRVYLAKNICTNHVRTSSSTDGFTDAEKPSLPFSAYQLDNMYFDNNPVDNNSTLQSIQIPANSVIPSRPNNVFASIQQQEVVDGGTTTTTNYDSTVFPAVPRNTTEEHRLEFGWKYYKEFTQGNDAGSRWLLRSLRLQTTVSGVTTKFLGVSLTLQLNTLSNGYLTKLPNITLYMNDAVTSGNNTSSLSYYNMNDHNNVTNSVSTNIKYVSSITATYANTVVKDNIVPSKATPGDDELYQLNYIIDDKGILVLDSTELNEYNYIRRYSNSAPTMPYKSLRYSSTVQNNNTYPIQGISIDYIPVVGTKQDITINTMAVCYSLTNTSTNIKTYSSDVYYFKQAPLS